MPAVVTVVKERESPPTAATAVPTASVKSSRKIWPWVIGVVVLVVIALNLHGTLGTLSQIGQMMWAPIVPVKVPQGMEQMEVPPAPDIPLEGSPKQLVITAVQGESELIKVPPPNGIRKWHIVVGGNGDEYLVHNLYENGDKCSAKEECKDGSLQGNTVSNETSSEERKDVTVYYYFAPG